MSVEFQYITDEALKEFIPRSIEEYAQSMVDVGEYDDITIPRKLAHEEVAGYFPNDTLRPNEHILTVHLADKTSTQIGIVWVTIYQEDDGSLFAFLVWIETFSEFRRQGLAEKTLLTLERFLIEGGIQRLELCVFAHNLGAQKLYKKCGYHVTHERKRNGKVSRIDMAKHFEGTQ